MRIRFHKGLYPRAALDEAVETFRETARIEVSREGDYWSVAIEPTEAGIAPDEAAGEFQNYVLGVTVAQRGKA